MCEKEGSWGVSYARIPTSTRTGHAAMTAGFDESILSLVKGKQPDFMHYYIPRFIPVIIELAIYDQNQVERL